MNYASTEIGLIPATRKLLKNRPVVMGEMIPEKRVIKLKHKAQEIMRGKVACSHVVS